MLERSIPETQVPVCSDTSALTSFQAIVQRREIDNAVDLSTSASDDEVRGRANTVGSATSVGPLRRHGAQICICCEVCIMCHNLNWGAARSRRGTR